jgi:putative membrane protein
MDKHSKWPIMMRMHGSVMPKMIMPILTVAIWSTAVTVFSKKVHDRKYLQFERHQTEIWF